MGQRIVAIIQARMGSSRLPGKVLLDIAGRPMLAWVVERASLSRYISEVVIATTTADSDEPIQAWCGQHGVACFRGDSKDVLDRYFKAAEFYRADVIVRFTADCPLLDPGVVDETIEAFLQQGADFAANRLPPPFTRTYPIGLDTEVCSFGALQRAWHEASGAHEREHVMPYLYEQPGRFRVCQLNYKEDLGKLRWTVDTAQDLEFIRQVVARFGIRTDFSWLEVLALLEREPQLASINADVDHKTYLDVDDRS